MRSIGLLSVILMFLNGCVILSSIPDLQDEIVNDLMDTIWLESGRYRLDTSILIPSNTVLLGENTILLFDKNSKFPLLALKEVRNVHIQNIKFEGDTLDNELNSHSLEIFNYNYIISITQSKNIQVDDVTIRNSYGTGVKILDGQDIEIRNCTFSNIGVASRKQVPYSYDGIFIGGNIKSSAIDIRGCLFDEIGTVFASKNPPWPNDGDGVHIQQIRGISSNINIHNNKFRDCSARGVKLQTGEVVSIRQNTFERCSGGINMAMCQDLEGIDIVENTFDNCDNPIGTDTAIADDFFVEKLTIASNTVDHCSHFLRTSGRSSILKGSITNNTIGTIETYVLLGRFLDTQITENRVGKYANSNAKSYNMAIYLSPESERVTIENNIFRKSQNSDRTVVDKSISKNILLGKNNKFE